MNERQITLARHALGLDGRRKKSYRNRFIAGSGHVDFSDWMEMTKNGYAVRRNGNPLTGHDDLFLLTLSGAKMALRPGETLDHEDFPSSAPI